MSRDAGISKGPTWFRCRPCHAAATKLDYTASQNDERSKALKDLKRTNKGQWRLDVIKVREDSERGVKSNAASAYLEQLVVESSLKIREGVKLMNRKQWAVEEMKMGRTEEEAGKSFDAAVEGDEYKPAMYGNEQVVVAPKPKEVIHDRGQRWSRKIQQPVCATHYKSRRLSPHTPIMGILASALGPSLGPSPGPSPGAFQAILRRSPEYPQTFP